MKNLIWNEEFARKVLPFVKDSYFKSNEERILFKQIHSFIIEYNALPSKSAIEIKVRNLENVNDSQVKESVAILDEIELRKDEKTDLQWLLDQTEKFCQEKAVYNAVLESIKILDDDTGKPKGAIPQLLTDALAVSFDTNVGHDYLDNSDARYDFYHRIEKKIPFDIDFMNKITGGGVSQKTLNICLAGTGVGKSLFMCHCAAANLSAGHNVLYITLEMAEEKIAERIDANLLNVALDDLQSLPKATYDKKIERLRSLTKGKLIIKEYPTASASSINFRALLNELNLKRSFKPDIVYIDYLNICTSSRIKAGSNINSYTLIKSIAEELRGLAVEFRVPIISATQTTRTGFSSTDVELTDTSESFGLPATADFMFALISTEELEQLNQVMVKQLKNRYKDPTVNKRFVVGIERAKMRLYDVEADAQKDIGDANQTTSSTPVMNKTTFGQRMSKDKFKEFKV